uniref:transposase n=1 Tax=Magnetospirillum molischianum TaxID=1083 RepID=UPI00138AF37A
MKAQRRTFTAAYKLAVLAELDCAKAGETGAILRREGLYSSSLVTWRRQRKQGLLQPQAPVRRGPPAARKSDGAQELDRLRRENARLERHLAKAHLIIGIQKKLRNSWRSIWAGATTRADGPCRRSAWRTASGGMFCLGAGAGHLPSPPPWAGPRPPSAPPTGSRPDGRRADRGAGGAARG